jgi:hypothetical protein
MQPSLSASRLVTFIYRICWQTIFYLWETTVVRQAIAFDEAEIPRFFRTKLLMPAASPLSRHRPGAFATGYLRGRAVQRTSG